MSLEGYVLIGRRDRQDGQMCQGVAVFAHALPANNITSQQKSPTSERIWVVVYSDLVPHLVGVRYRPPEQGEAASTKSLREEWSELNPGVMSTVIVGDKDIHHEQWQWKSSRNTAEG